MRYEIRVIGNGEGIDSLGQVIAQAATDIVAKRKAEKRAYDYHYGVAIVDTEKETIDWGSEITDYSGENLIHPPRPDWGF